MRHHHPTLTFLLISLLLAAAIGVTIKITSIEQDLDTMNAPRYTYLTVIKVASWVPFSVFLFVLLYNVTKHPKKSSRPPSLSLGSNPNPQRHWKSKWANYSIPDRQGDIASYMNTLRLQR